MKNTRMDISHFRFIPFNLKFSCKIVNAIHGRSQGGGGARGPEAPQLKYHQ